MPINPVLLQNQQDKIPDIYKDFLAVKKAVAPNETDSIFDETIPVYGQVSDLEEHVKNNDFDTVGAITSLAVLKGPEEIDELFSAADQIKHKIQGKKYKHPYDYTKAELESSFFRDSTLAKHMNYRSKYCVFPKIIRSRTWIIYRRSLALVIATYARRRSSSSSSGSIADCMLGNIPSSKPGRNTTGNSRPFAL